MCISRVDWRKLVEGGGSDMKFVKNLMGNVVEQQVKLEKEVKKYCEERGV